MLRKISAIRNRLRLLIYMGGALWVLFILYFIKNNFNTNVDKSSNYSIYNLYDNYKYEDSNVKSSKTDNTLSAPTGIIDPHFTNHTTFKNVMDIMFSNETKTNDFTSNIYANIFKNHDMDTILGTLSFRQRCDLYFKNVFLDNVNWIFDPERNYNVRSEGKEFDQYVKANRERLEKEFEPRKKKIKEDQVEQYFNDFTKDKYFVEESDKNEQDIINQLSLFRIFNKCYITNDEVSQIDKTTSFITNQQKLVHDLSSKKIENFHLNEAESLVDLLTSAPATFENRVYPWISKEYPVYQRYTGKIYHEPPNYYNLLKDPFQKSSPSKKYTTKSSPFSNGGEEPFIKKFKNKCNGKGIVLSIADKHVDHMVSLIHLLRALDNKLPIQIVYFDDVSEDAKKKIVTAAQEEFKSLPESFNKIAHLFGDDYLDLKMNGKGLQPQEVWFVNVHNAIHKNFRGKFSRFGNKLLATFFNSFDEFMLIDADTVMMKPPEYFFKLDGYIKTGTFFFRDRTVQRRAIEDGEFIVKVSPNLVDSIMFDIPVLTNYTMNKEYFHGLQHYMESGVVLLNKNLHLNSILTILEINMISRIRKLSYGDKELFWLGFVINGDENYIFNGHPAGAVGELTPPDDRPRKDGSLHNSHEICANHPCHVSSEDNHSLLWMNSGFRYCHQVDEVNFKDEAKHKSRLKFLNTPNAFETYYNAPLRITHAIIPPLDPELKDRNNVEEEPNKGWYWEKNYCKKYMWCAYSSIGGKQKDENKKDNTLQGLLVGYTDEEIKLFNYLGDIWVGVE